MKTNIKMICFDMDGTLLNDNKVIPDANIKSIKYISENNIIPVIATGRHLKGVLPSLQSIPEVKYVITSNGASIYELSSQKKLYNNPIDNNIVLTLISKLDLNNVMFDIFVDSCAYMEEKNMKFVNEVNIPEVVRDYIISSRIKIPSIKEYLLSTHNNIDKITINFRTDSTGNILYRKETIDIINEFGCLSCVSGGLNNVEVSMSTATKGITLTKLSQLINIPIESMMAFGDSGNDYDMIKSVGFGVAMENADKEIKAVADYITLSNNNNGVAYAINKFIN